MILARNPSLGPKIKQQAINNGTIVVVAACDF
jgi:hypothetical protein